MEKKEKKRIIVGGFMLIFIGGFFLVSNLNLTGNVIKVNNYEDQLINNSKIIEQIPSNSEEDFAREIDQIMEEYQTLLNESMISYIEFESQINKRLEEFEKVQKKFEATNNKSNEIKTKLGELKKSIQESKKLQGKKERVQKFSYLNYFMAIASLLIISLTFMHLSQNKSFSLIRKKGPKIFKKKIKYLDLTNLN